MRSLTKFIEAIRALGAKYEPMDDGYTYHNIFVEVHGYSPQKTYWVTNVRAYDCITSDEANTEDGYDFDSLLEFIKENAVKN